jgi:hypothetical protein
MSASEVCVLDGFVSMRECGEIGLSVDDRR